MPIAYNERVLGVLDVQHNVADGLDETDADMLSAIANQTAIALQNARLFQETQQQASLEAMLNSIVQQIQETTTVESALQITARELGRALGRPVRVRLQTETPQNGR